jgi:hypothetical protein
MQESRGAVFKHVGLFASVIVPDILSYVLREFLLIILLLK